MKNCREVWYDSEKKIKVTFVDTLQASQDLVNAHLCGPVSGYFLSKALSAAALLAEELTLENESISIQMKCDGPLGGLNVECTQTGLLRGYTEKKIFDEYDGIIKQPVSYAFLKKIIGEKRVQISRTIPGKILAQGCSNSLDSYLVSSLQRKAVIYTEAFVSDELKVELSRGVLIECLPDCTETKSLYLKPKSLQASPRKILEELNLPKAEKKSCVPLAFGCRCDANRAKTMLNALTDEEKRDLPDKVDITCHMCGRTFTVEVPR